MKILCLLLPLLMACAVPLRSESDRDWTVARPVVGARLADIIQVLDLSRDLEIVDDPRLAAENLLGQARWYPTRYLVRIDPNLTDREWTMVALHELAHVVAWDSGSGESGHGLEWGLAFSEVYRIWAGEPCPWDPLPVVAGPDLGH